MYFKNMPVNCKNIVAEHRKYLKFVFFGVDCHVSKQETNNWVIYARVRHAPNEQQCLPEFIVNKYLKQMFNSTIGLIKYDHSTFDSQ